MKATSEMIFKLRSTLSSWWPHRVEKWPLTGEVNEGLQDQTDE